MTGVRGQMTEKQSLRTTDLQSLRESGEAALYEIDEADFMFMTCERYHCRMRKAMCVARQLKADEAIKRASKLRYVKWKTDGEMRYWMCYDCAQGREVAKETGVLRRPDPPAIARAQARRARVRKKKPATPRKEGQKAHGGKYSKGEEFPEIAKKIREIRENKGWTQYQLGAWCGLDQSVISRAELGYPISKETAGTIAKAIEQMTDDRGQTTARKEKDGED